MKNAALLRAATKCTSVTGREFFFVWEFTCNVKNDALRSWKAVRALDFGVVSSPGDLLYNVLFFELLVFDVPLQMRCKY